MNNIARFQPRFQPILGNMGAPARRQAATEYIGAVAELNQFLTSRLPSQTRHYFEYAAMPLLYAAAQAQTFSMAMDPHSDPLNSFIISLAQNLGAVTIISMMHESITGDNNRMREDLQATVNDKRASLRNELSACTPQQHAEIVSELMDNRVFENYVKDVHGLSNLSATGGALLAMDPGTLIQHLTTSTNPAAMLAPILFANQASMPAALKDYLEDNPNVAKQLKAELIERARSNGHIRDNYFEADGLFRQGMITEIPRQIYQIVEDEENSELRLQF